MTKKDWFIDAWARAAAHGLAHAQHLGDKVIEWGFQKMDDVSKEEPKKSAAKNEYRAGAESIGRKILGTLGGAGKAYYEKYEELKKQK